MNWLLLVRLLLVLAFYPGEQYEYGTVNYDVLGLVIEVLSGQSYERFMIEQVLHPLGLHNTYLYQEDALATGQLAQGYRSSFFITSPHDAPDYAGNKPAAYIISSTNDMAGWMRIQLGLEEDIPEIFKAVVQKSHEGNSSNPDVDGMLYGAGWSISADRTLIEHSGGNPNFSTFHHLHFISTISQFKFLINISVSLAILSYSIS